jgi:hypothetical protein
MLPFAAYRRSPVVVFTTILIAGSNSPICTCTKPIYQEDRTSSEHSAHHQRGRHSALGLQLCGLPLPVHRL